MPSLSSIIRFLSTPSARRATLTLLSLISPVTFLSTPSARRATQLISVLTIGGMISIHALREEGDHRHITVGRR